MKKNVFVWASLMLCLVLKVNAQNERMMLLESFTNIGCEPCANQNPAFDALIDTNANRVVAIKYHTNWPLSNDPMYVANADDINARTDYYHVVSVPTAILDGNRYYSAPSGVTQFVIDQLLGIPSSFEMQLELEADTLNNRVHVSVMGQTKNAVVGDLRLFVALVENEIHYEVAPGSNGEKDFFHVLKTFLSDASGQSLGNFDVGQPFAFVFDSELIQNQNLNNLSAVGWIQNYNTKEVYQACKCDAVSTQISETTQETIQVFPNPTEGIVNILADGQNVFLFNMMGQSIYESRGEDAIVIDMKPFGTGIYVVKIGNQTRRIVIK